MHPTFKDCFDGLAKSAASYRVLLSGDLHERNEALLGVVVKSNCQPNDGPMDHLDAHNTIITLLYQGQPKEWERTLEACVGDGERVSTSDNAAIEKGQPVHAIRMHCGFEGYNLDIKTRGKLRDMLDALLQKGLVSQPIVEAAYQECDLLPRKSKETGGHGSVRQ